MSRARPLSSFALALAGAALALAACGDDGGPAGPDANELPAWHPELPPATVMGIHRGWQGARGIIHLHSPYSHDACDGNPRPGGVPDETCLAHLRAALCTTRMDFAALTDHDSTMADEDFQTLFLQRGGDVLVRDAGGNPIASRLLCPDGRKVLLTVGSENPIMSVMLDRHVTGTLAERHAIYNGDDPAAVAAMRDAGATVWIAHTEQRTSAVLADLAPDGIEIYNLHANLDPDIRRDYLGLSEDGAITAALQFGGMDVDGPEPDLALLGFLSPSGPALTVWDELLARGMHVAGSAGTDAHENTLPITLKDGERGDSYRRLMRWFSNVVLVHDTGEPAQIEEGLREGRMYVAFELLGTPVDFEVRAVAEDRVVELGGSVPVDLGARLEVNFPTIHELSPLLPAPTVHGRILRVDARGATEVASSDGPTMAVDLDQIGAYRVELTMVPHHLAPYLHRLGPDFAEQELPWIYASPIYVLPVR